MPEHIRGRLIGMLESMANVGAVLGAPVGGLLWDRYHGVDLGLPFAIDGTVIPFLISGGLGVATVSMVLLLVRDRKASSAPG